MAKLKNKVNYLLAMLATVFGASDVLADEGEVKSAGSEEEAKASEEQSLEQDVVENAVDQAENAGEEIPVTTAAEEPTVKEKYKDAFGIDNFEIKL